ncbi:MAG: hypothetical protein Q9218_002843 [Villophora microphyllina]
MTEIQTMPLLGAPQSELAHEIVSKLADMNGIPRSKKEWTPPPSNWTPMCHPRVSEVTEEVDGYFLEHWPFPDKKAEQGFRRAAFSRVTCLYFPLARDDSIHFAYLLEDMSFADGKAYNEKLIPIARGDVLPDRSIAAEYITYNLWESMRAHNRELANSVLEPTFLFMRAQTDKVRLKKMRLGEYLEYRDKDVGKALLSALMRFSMGFQLTPEEAKSMTRLEYNCSKQISVVNDIYSWEKELKASKTGHREGAALCSAVKVVAEETNLSYEAAKRVLWSMAREWENTHAELAAELLAAPEGVSQNVRKYIQGLEYQMSGNELWSRTTLRYRV